MGECLSWKFGWVYSDVLARMTPARAGELKSVAALELGFPLFPEPFAP